MWFPTFFESKKASTRCRPVQALRKPSRLQTSSCRLNVEALEDRQVPASLSVSDVSILEGNSGTRNALVTVSLTGSSNPTVSVRYSTSQGTALSGSDYQAVSGTLNFPKGVTSRSILIPIIGDTTVESDEAFFVNLSNPKKATIADGQGIVTIANDDTSISVGDVWLSEGYSGTTNFVFTVSLSSAMSQPVSVNYVTANGTADSDSDYQSASGTLTIPAGQTSSTFTVLVNGDDVSEEDEYFFVNLSNPINGTIADGQGMGVILNDEPYISITDVYATEGNSGTTEFNFVVMLSVASPHTTVTVDYATADDSATTEDSDYTATSGTLTFAPGETSMTITVQVSGDLLVEYDEFFVVNLSNASNAQFSNSQAWGAIQSDDNAVFHIESVWGWEPDPYEGGITYFAFTVWLTTPFTETVTVDFHTVDGSATEWSDYLPDAGTLTFAPGETSQVIYVAVQADWDYEWDEYFSVILSNPTSNALIQPYWDVGTGTIYDYYYW
jgi:hypothetical protein